MEVDEATLILADVRRVEVSSERQLQHELEALSQLQTGQTATLERGPTDYIRATRQGEFWSIVVRRKGMWIAQSFTAGMTTEYSERRVREVREAGSLVAKVFQSMRSPAPEFALSSAQVQTVFVEYLQRRKFSIPFSGA